MKNNKKSILSIFIANYVMTIVVLFLSIFIFLLVVISQYYPKLNSIDAEGLMKNEKIFKSNYSNINKNDVIKNRGWIEIIKDKKIDKVIGDKKDEIKDYNNLENIINDAQLKEKYDVKAYRGKSDKDMYIVKIPKKEYLMEDYDYQSKGERIKNFIRVALILCIVFILLVMTLMAYVSIKAISKPLRKIQQGINEMTKGNYSVRLNFNTYKEINGIKDSFNYMVDELEFIEKEKEESENSKKRIVTSISHDIKTPITSIMGYSKALIDKKELKEEEKSLYLSYIYNKTIRLNYLVDELFSFTKLDNPNYKLNKENHDFTDFLREIIAFYYGDIEEKGFDIDIQIPEKEINLNFDYKEMERALGNLIVNSLKYNPSGTKITFILKEYDNVVKLIIQDDGIGIKKDFVDSIFSEFVRGDKSRSSKEGSGLGLAITKRIIELHDGIITVESEEDKGTKFTIIFT
ncbi:HAMP domain-containing sensor histidine kinase [Clostridium oceanicum]|uniref:histidine kinase n=1 Tax=Clostridium oceanicum TaxID=1543 RepID=A0ABP3UY60_9CLOT